MAEELADCLIARAPAGLDRVFFVSGGSEAIEVCLKLARQYFFETGAHERRHIIARRQSYHGITLGALAAGGHVWRSEPFGPLLFPARYIAPCYAYREQFSDESDEAYGRRAADDLEAAIDEFGPETVAAFVAEPVVGATMGAVPPAPGSAQAGYEPVSGRYRDVPDQGWEACTEKPVISVRPRPIA